MPVNQNATYLSNAREMAISCVKGGKATFNSKYDKGIYEYPIYSGKDRFHPTQKSLPLFEELIKKHSNPNDIVDALAEFKAARVANNYPTDIVIGSDQILVFEGEIISKAKNMI